MGQTWIQDTRDEASKAPITVQGSRPTSPLLKVVRIDSVQRQGSRKTRDMRRPAEMSIAHRRGLDTSVTMEAGPLRTTRSIMTTETEGRINTTDMDGSVQDMEGWLGERPKVRNYRLSIFHLCIEPDIFGRRLIFPEIISDD